MCLLYVPFTHTEDTLLVTQTTTWRDVFEPYIQDIVQRKENFTKVFHSLSRINPQKPSSHEASSSSIAETQQTYDIGIDMHLKKSHASVDAQ